MSLDLIYAVHPQGAAGIVAKPVQGAEKGGISGFFGGMARGLAGAVAAPVTGTLSAFSKVGGGGGECIGCWDVGLNAPHPPALCSQVTEGLDSTYAAVKSSMTFASTRKTGRRRLPRPFTGDRILRPFNLHAALGQALLYETGMPQAPTLVPAALHRLGGAGGGANRMAGTVSSGAEVFPFRHDAYEQHFVMKSPQVGVGHMTHETTSHRCLCDRLSSDFHNPCQSPLIRPADTVLARNDSTMT